MGFELYNDIPLEGLEPLAAYVRRATTTIVLYTNTYVCAVSFACSCIT